MSTPVKPDWDSSNAHRHDVAQNGIRELLAARRPTPNGHDYVGSKRCMPCHIVAYQSWEKSAHSHAWATLEKAEAGDRYGWPVTRYPDCVSCHTVGYRQRSGFVSPERTPDLRSVGCEECHGPGGQHVLAPQRTRLGEVPLTKCNQCHDYEQSPDFDYEERWKKIEHGK